MARTPRVKRSSPLDPRSDSWTPGFLLFRYNSRPYGSWEVPEEDKGPIVERLKERTLLPAGGQRGRSEFQSLSFVCEM